MGCGDEKLSKYLTQTFTAHCNAMICQQVTLSSEAEWPKVADAVIEAHCNTMICQQVMLSGEAEWPKVADAVIEATYRTSGISTGRGWRPSWLGVTAVSPK